MAQNKLPFSLFLEIISGKEAHTLRPKFPGPFREALKEGSWSPWETTMKMSPNLITCSHHFSILPVLSWGIHSTLRSWLVGLLYGGEPFHLPCYVDLCIVFGMCTERESQASTKIPEFVKGWWSQALPLVQAAPFFVRRRERVTFQMLYTPLLLFVFKQNGEQSQCLNLNQSAGIKENINGFNFTLHTYACTFVSTHLLWGILYMHWE